MAGLDLQFTGLHPKIAVRLIIDVIAPPVIIGVINGFIKIFRFHVPVSVGPVESSMMALIRWLVFGKIVRRESRRNSLVSHDQRAEKAVEQISVPTKVWRAVRAI